VDIRKGEKELKVLKGAAWLVNCGVTGEGSAPCGRQNHVVAKMRRREERQRGAEKDHERLHLSGGGER